MASTSRPTKSGADSDGSNGAGLAVAAPKETLRLDPAVGANTLSEYLKAWVQRVRNGESGMLPVLGGLILIVIIFQSQKSVFLSAANLTNLLVQGATFVLLGMAEVFVLLLGEIDLSIGYLGRGRCGVTASIAAPPGNHPWWVAILGGLIVCAAIGCLAGRLDHPPPGPVFHRHSGRPTRPGRTAHLPRRP